MKVTKKYEAKSIEKHVIRKRNIKWEATQAWKWGWQKKYLPA
jgi:hypothetical protein